MTLAQNFIDGLKHLEQRKDPEPLLQLFSDDCVIGNVVTQEEFRGRDAARRFWEDYRSTFEQLSSEFRNVIESEGAVALEWTTTGSAKGSPVSYEGVSIFELQDGLIRRFHGYFDSRRLQHIARNAGVAASQSEAPRKPAVSESADSEDFTAGRDCAHPGGYG